MALLIKGGNVVNYDYYSPSTDVLISDGIIKEVGKGLQPPEGARVIDATGKLVIPGGIDPHTHMDFKFMGTVTVDDFESGTSAAVAGGTTTIIDFVLREKGSSLLEAYEDYRKRADAQVVCDYALHGGISWWSPQVSEEMEILCNEKGVNSFKCFLAYKGALMLESDELYHFMKRCKELGALALVHAEDGNLVYVKQADLIKKGITGPEGHLLSRPEEVEAAGTLTAVTASNATGCPVYIVHVTSKAAAKVVSHAKQERKLVFGEAVTAGIAGDGHDYFHKCWEHAARYVLTPPMRLDADFNEFIISLLANGDLECVGSDHCTFKSDQKALGRNDFRKIPNGGNGVEERMMLLWQKGVRTGKLDVQQFVALTSSRAAQIFGLYPRKGRIAAGSEADICIWDANKEHTISKDTHHSRVDYNLFEGFVSKGSPDTVIVRGRVCFENGKLSVERGFGRYLPTACFNDYVYARVRLNDDVVAEVEKPVARDA